jgi:hypothetical protein
VQVFFIAGKATDSVTHGFLPAAERLGLDVTVLTDRPDEHRGVGHRVVACDVADYREVIQVVRDIAGDDPTPTSPTATTCRRPPPWPPSSTGCPARTGRPRCAARTST